MAIGVYGTCTQQFQRVPKKVNVGRNATFSYHCQTTDVDGGVATLLSMDSSPVPMMSTIHSPSGEDSLVLRMRNHPGNKSTIATEANFTFLDGECQKELHMPVIVNAYNQNKVGVDVAN